MSRQGIDKIEDILFRNAIDVATAAKRVREIIQAISTGLQKKSQIKSGLTGYVEEEAELADEVLIRVIFEGRAAISNVVDLKVFGAEWHDIGRGIAMAHELAPEDIRVVGATKGSIIVELAVVYGVAKTAGAIIHEALRVAERVLEIRQKAEEIRGLKLKNDSISAELEKSADEEKKNGVSRITTDIAKQLKLSPKGDGDKREALQRSVNLIVSFIDKGGSIDCVVPQEEPPDEEEMSTEEKKKYEKLEELREAFSNIRALEAQVKQIEKKNAEEEEQDDDD